MALPDDLSALAGRRRFENQSVIAQARLVLRAQWTRVDPNAPEQSWDNAIGPIAGRLMRAAQIAAAHGAQEYVTATLEAQGIDPDSEGVVPPEVFSGTASDGDDLDGLLRLPAVATQQAIDAGAPTAEALDTGRKQLERIVSTQVGDAARVPTGVAVVAAKHANGYIRMATPPSCARCIILAGKWYADNTGFKRHPLCDCVHIAADEATAEHYTTNPHAYFDRLTEDEQDQLFTHAGAQAIRDGADIFQVVNARLKVYRLTTAAGQKYKATKLGVTKRSLAGMRLSKGGKRIPIRLMPEALYQIAGNSRTELLRLLRLHGYVV